MFSVYGIPPSNDDEDARGPGFPGNRRKSRVPTKDKIANVSNYFFPPNWFERKFPNIPLEVVVNIGIWGGFALIVWICIILFDKPREKAQPTKQYRIDTEQIEGHSYLIVRGYRSTGMVHSENCICKINEVKE